MFELLSAHGRKVYQFILSGIQRGLSGAQILRELRELGEGYRIQDFYNDLRIIKGEAARWDTMKYVRRDRVISADLYTPTTTPLPHNFITRFRVDYVDLQTNELKTLYTSVGHDIPMRRADLEDMIMMKLDEVMNVYENVMNYRIVRVMPVSGWRRV